MKYIYQRNHINLYSYFYHFYNSYEIRGEIVKSRDRNGKNKKAGDSFNSKKMKLMQMETLDLSVKLRDKSSIDLGNYEIYVYRTSSAWSIFNKN